MIAPSVLTLALPELTLPEEWRAVPGHPAYEVSSHGRVRRVARGIGAVPGRVLRAWPQRSKGYLSLTLYTARQRRDVLVHRLVAAAFLGPCPPGHEVNHRDGHKPNNAAANLEYVTGAENMRHAAARGLVRVPSAPRSRVSASDRARMETMRAEGRTLREIGTTLGVSAAWVCKLLRGAVPVQGYADA